MAKLPPKMWFVVRNIHPLGIASGDPHTDWDCAYDDFAECVTDGEAVIVLEHDVSVMTIRDVTDKAERELRHIEAMRGLTPDNIVRWESPLPA